MREKNSRQLKSIELKNLDTLDKVNINPKKNSENDKTGTKTKLANSENKNNGKKNKKGQPANEEVPVESEVATPPPVQSGIDDNKISLPRMSKEKNQVLNAEHPVQEEAKEGAWKHAYDDDMALQEMESPYSPGPGDNMPYCQEENEVEQYPPAKKIKDSPPSKEELLAELRSIARREARYMQEQHKDREEETYYHPPVSPSKHPLEYLREIYRTENRLVERSEFRTRTRRLEREPSDSSMHEEDAEDFKSFNDFDEGIFKFDSNSKMFHCPWADCDKSFPSLSRIKRHYIIHTDYKPFKCLNPGCNRRFSRKDNMHQHYRVHCPFAGQSSKHL